MQSQVQVGDSGISITAVGNFQTKKPGLKPRFFSALASAMSKCTALRVKAFRLFMEPIMQKIGAKPEGPAPNLLGD
jgi:hypothetical protein